jgi:nucleoside-diphosphate-sugar epimerase
MRVFLTGGSGFIGQHVINTLLENGIEVLLISRDEKKIKSANNVKIIEGNLSDLSNIKDEISEFKPDYIIHLAWEGIPDYSYQTNSKNIIYSLNVLNLCKEISCENILITGTCLEYKVRENKASENDTLVSDSGFTFAKNTIKSFAEEFCNENGINLCWIRPFYVYGEGQRDASLIPYIINNLKNGIQPDLKNAFNEHDYIYVKDLAEAIYAIIKKNPKNQVFNVGSGSYISVMDILKIVSNECGVELDYSKYHKTDYTRFFADISKIKNVVNWEPKYKLNHVIKGLV